MAYIRCMAIAVCILLYNAAGAQTIFYPAGASQLLKETAADMAMLLQQALRSPVSAQAYSSSSAPGSGILLVYDSTITHNQRCRIEGSSSLLRFYAAEDNGLVFGIYHYLRLLGFRFYQPGTAWEKIPQLSSPYRIMSTTVTGNYKYQSWFISGGHNRWVMDNTTAYNWDTYYGSNGHSWALYQRRNGMGGTYRFAGHRTDILSSSYLATLQNNPCYVACYNGSRQPGMQSVPDVNSASAMALWGNAIEQKYTQLRSTVYGNTTLYNNIRRNFSYNHGLIGLEVPDGAQWGNSADNNCGTADYESESSQQFTVADEAVKTIAAKYPAAAFQCYAYSSHAGVPPATIPISGRLDVQVIPGAFQMESSTVGLMNRWYARHSNISEYHYLNIPQWGGETPMFYKSSFVQTLRRLKDKNSQGIVWEASPAKFASLPWLLAAANQLQYNISADSTVKEFCDAMFGPAAVTIYQLLQLWTDEKAVTTGDFIPDNRYKLPLYLQLAAQAAGQAQQADAAVKERLTELKAYLHYMVLYYDWLFDQRSSAEKQDKAAALCLYLAGISRMQVVNSYFLIADIVSRYGSGSSFYAAYNPGSGTAYQGGSLPQISPAAVEAAFAADVQAAQNRVQQYKLEPTAAIRDKFAAAGMQPLQKIRVKIGYTNGYNYPNRSEFYMDAPGAGSITIQYQPQFLMPGKGYINFTVEAAGTSLQVLKDVSIDRTSGAGQFTVQLPAAGTYKLTVTSKYKSSADITVNTGNCFFYKNTAFLGNKTENYRADLLSLPGWFYIPQGISRIYFSVNNGNPGGRGFATPADISKAFAFKDHNGNMVQALAAPGGDSALYYLPVPQDAGGSFWQAVKMEQYNLCFANISNVLWYAACKPCSGAAFTATILSRYGTCITQLQTLVPGNAQRWEVYDQNKWFYYDGRTAELPNYISPNAIVTLRTGSTCIATRRLGDDEKYLRQKEACASGAPLAEPAAQPVLYPNPSTGVFSCMSGGLPVLFETLVVTDSRGMQAARFSNIHQFDISGLAAGFYQYACTVNGMVYRGKIVKL